MQPVSRLLTNGVEPAAPRPSPHVAVAPFAKIPPATESKLNPSPTTRVGVRKQAESDLRLRIWVCKPIESLWPSSSPLDFR